MRLLLLFLLLTGGARARERAAELQVSRRGDQVWVRITARNTGPRRLPVRISLYARSVVGPWLLIRQWPTEHDLPPGHKLSRELFADSSQMLRWLAGGRRLHLRALVTGPGLRGEAERTLVER